MSYSERPNTANIQPKPDSGNTTAHRSLARFSGGGDRHIERTKSWDDTIALYDILTTSPTAAEAAPNPLSIVASATLENLFKACRQDQQPRQKEPGKREKISYQADCADEPCSFFAAKEVSNFDKIHRLPAEFKPVSIWPEIDGGITLLGGGKGILVHYGPDGDKRWQVLLNQQNHSDAHHIIGAHLPGGKTILCSQSRQIALYGRTGKLLDQKQLAGASLTGGFFEPTYGQYHVQDWALYQGLIYDKNWNFIRYYELPTGIRRQEKLARIALDVKNQRVLAVFSGPRGTGERPFFLAAYDLNGNFMRFLGLPVIAGVTPFLGVAPTKDLVLLASKRRPLISLDSKGNRFPGALLPTPYSFCLTDRKIYLIDRLDLRIRSYEWQTKKYQAVEKVQPWTFSTAS